MTAFNGNNGIEQRRFHEQVIWSVAGFRWESEFIPSGKVLSRHCATKKGENAFPDCKPLLHEPASAPVGPIQSHLSESKPALRSYLQAGSEAPNC